MEGGPKIILAGGSGFLGRVLARRFFDRGFHVVVLSRSGTSVPAARAVRWDGEHLGPWTGELENAAALINLAGRSVNCRYNARNKREIMDSRILSTRVLGEAIHRCASPPEVWLNSSTATIYKHTFGPPHDEKAGEIGAAAEANDAFSIDVAQAWEDEFHSADCPKTRTVTLRTAVVLGNERGSAYDVLRRLVRFGLGGKMGDGRQYFSWIHELDFCRALEWIIEHRECRGAYNVCAPQPLTNQEMMAELRAALKMPFGLPAPRWILQIGVFLLRTESELVLKSRRVIPGRLSAEGFAFDYPVFADAVKALEQSVDDANAETVICSGSH